MVAVGTDASASRQYEDVACPFCGILCDDLSVAAAGNGLKVLKNGCPKAIAGFERALPQASPRIAGKPVTLAAAVAEAAARIRAARQPIFGGLATDVEGMRAVMAAAEKAGAVVDHALSDAQYRNYRVLQSTGWVMTTLTEARNRADLFIIVASDIHAQHPRFFERVVLAERSMFTDSPKKRTVVFLGEGLDTSAATGDRIGEVVSLPVETTRIAELMAALRALAKGVSLPGDDIAGLPRAAVEDLLARCKAADYGVMVWTPASFAFADADLTVQSLSEFVKDLNLTSRFAGLSLGGNEGSASAGAVCAWQSGFPLRVSFASGAPDYDSERYAANRMLAAGESDLLVWIACYTTDLTPPTTDVPTILIATPGTTLAREPDVFIPVGTPGADHAGLLVRCDSVVTLPMQNLGRAPLPAASDVIAMIETAI